MKKRTVVVLLCLTLVCALSACNLAEMEFGGLVGELLEEIGGAEPEHVVGVEPMPETQIGEWTDMTMPDIGVEIQPELPVDIALSTNSIVMYETEGALQLKDTEAEIVRESILSMDQYFEQTYGISVEHKVADAQTMLRVVQNDAVAGSGVVYLCYLPLCEIGEISTSGYFYSDVDIATLDLYNGCWYQGFNDDLRINGRQYAFAGVLTPYVQLNTDCLVYNREKMEEMGFHVNEYFYNNEWTLEKFSELCEKTYQDLNGNGTLDAEDCFGAAYQAGCREDHLFYGSGFDLFDKGTLSDYAEESCVDINYRLAVVRKYSYEGDQAHQMFESGRALFYATTLADYTGLDGSDPMVTYLPFESGVAPTPMYAKGSGYTSNVNPYTTPVLAIPATAGGDVGSAVNAMGILASEIYAPALEAWLYKVNPSSESVDMAQRIMDNVSCDVDSVMLRDGGLACNPLINQDPTGFLNQYTKSFEKHLKKIYSYVGE